QGGRPCRRSAGGAAAVGPDGRLVSRLGDCAVRVAGLLGWVEELDGLGDELDAGAALPVAGGPLVEAEPADDGHLPPFGEVFGAGGGQLVEADDVDEVGSVAAGAGDGEAEGGGLVLLAGVGGGVGGQTADESNTVH